MKVIIDRFEGESALLELPDRSILSAPKALFPGAAEGDVIEIRIDHEETIRRRKRISAIVNRLKKEK